MKHRKEIPTGEKRGKFPNPCPDTVVGKHCLERMPGFPYGRGTVYSRLESPMESYGEPCLFMPIACSPLLLCKSDERGRALLDEIARTVHRTFSSKE